MSCFAATQRRRAGANVVAWPRGNLQYDGSGIQVGDAQQRRRRDAEGWGGVMCVDQRTLCLRCTVCMCDMTRNVEKRETFQL